MRFGFKRIAIIVLLLLVLSFLLPEDEVNAQLAVPGGKLYELPLCSPDFYAVDPGNCLPLGPSQSIKELNEKGFTFPLQELAAANPDPSLADLPVRVARITGAETPVYASIDAALNGGAAIRTIPDGASRFVSVVDIGSAYGRTFVRMRSGEWVEAVPYYSWPKWQSLEFYETPKSDIGWTIYRTDSYTGPGFSFEVTGNIYEGYTAFPVYQVEEADGYFWYETAPDEWIPSWRARLVDVDTQRPEGVDRDRWISIDLFNQTMAAYENDELIFSALVATGAGELYSDPGLYQIYEKLELETMQGSYTRDRSDYYYLEAVPWTMYYNHAQAIHGIYWATTLGSKQSHGCVNMFPGDAHWLYNWAEMGEYVYVFDPSGQTPLPTPTPAPTPTIEATETP